MMARLRWSALALVFMLHGCSDSDPPERRYHARGLVTESSQDGDELSVAIHHEQIKAFEGRDGKRSNMDSMTMLFGVAKDLPPAMFSQGTKLAFDFDVRWSKRPTLLIVKAEKLPAETQLKLDSSH